MALCLLWVHSQLPIYGILVHNIYAVCKLENVRFVTNVIIAY